MGAAVFDPSGQPAWALSLTGIESRFSPERRPELGRLLLEHAHRLTEKLASR
jgi:DNA-binding IclR family transcriptional regulator